MDDFKIKKLKNITLKNPIIIEGLPGIGNVGKICLDFLVDSLNAKPFLEIQSDHFPNSVFVNENNLVDIPKIIFYFKKIGKTEFIFLTGDIQPSTEYGCYKFCHEILKIFKKYNVKNVITLGGIGMNKIPEKPKVYITGNSKRSLTMFKDRSLNRKIFGTVGPIMGVTGLLIGLAEEYRMNSVCLLSQTFAHPSYLGIRGAKSLLKVLDKKYKFKLNFKNLNKEIKDIESELETKIINQQPQAVSKEGASQVSYIG